MDDKTALMRRRTAIGLGISALAVLPSSAQAAPIPLWPGLPPGSPPTYNPADASKVPVILVRRAARPDGSAVMIPPGGAYAAQSMGGDGELSAKYFTARGVTVFIVRYRLPNAGWANRADVPLQDCQRAIRLVRANAAAFGVDPQRIGWLGYSSGGHMAASIATRWATQVYDPVDAVDQIDPRPNFAALIYPVITMGKGAHDWSRVNLIGRPQTAAQQLTYSPQMNIPPNAPPMFIAVGRDDKIVDPTANSVAMYDALLAAKIPAELHVFEVGPHGFGISDKPGTASGDWPPLFMRWGRQLGFFRNA